MNKEIMSKVLVLSVICLFIGMSVVPSSAINVSLEKTSTQLSIGGNTFYVGGSGPGNYTKIQDAVNDANSGDTVFVYKQGSPYYEEITINTPISLIGEDMKNTVIDGQDGLYDNVVTVNAPDVTINGFYIKGSSSSWGDSGIYITSNGNLIENCYFNKNENGIHIREVDGPNTIKDCIIYAVNFGRPTRGIYLAEANNCLITNCTFYEEGSSGVYIQGWRGRYATDNLIQKCKFFDNFESIYQFESMYNVVDDCDFFDSVAPVYFHYNCSRNTVKNCRLDGNYAGIYFYGDCENTYGNLFENLIITNTTTHPISLTVSRNDKIINVTIDNVTSENYGCGIYGTTGINCLISNCHITNCTISAIYFNHLRGTEISYNNLMNNKYGFWLYYMNSEENANIYFNNFKNNEKNIRYDYLPIKLHHMDYKFNYWDDYFGEDNDNNAIGDSPYIINEWEKDTTPLMQPLTDFDINAPNTPEISGPTNCEIGVEYEYKFGVIDPNNDDIYLQISWGDGESTGWIGQYTSGETVTLSHTWTSSDCYPIVARAKDTNDLIGPWGVLEINKAKNKATNNFGLFFRFLEQFPMLNKLLTLFIN